MQACEPISSWPLSKQHLMAAEWAGCCAGSHADCMLTSPCCCLQPIHNVYVDNAVQVIHLLKRLILTDLPGGMRVKQDPIHFMWRYTRVLPQHHPLCSSFGARLSEIVLPVYEPDFEARTDLDPKDRRKYCRKYMPEGSIILRKIEALLNEYEGKHDGSSFITPQVRQVHQAQQALVAGDEDMLVGKPILYVCRMRRSLHVFKLFAV